MTEQNLEAKVYRQIKEMMLEFDLVPGQRLVITELADQLGVSRTPVKMALIMLLKDGFLDYAPRQSAYIIHQLTREESDNLHKLRSILELGAIDDAMARITPARLAQLERKEAKFNEMGVSNGTRLRFVLDQDFHAAIVDLAGNPYLTTAFRDIYEKFFMRRSITRWFGERYAEVKSEHREIVEALGERDPQRAKQALSAHLQANKEFIDTVYF